MWLAPEKTRKIASDSARALTQDAGELWASLRYHELLLYNLTMWSHLVMPDRQDPAGSSRFAGKSGTAIAYHAGPTISESALHVHGDPLARFCCARKQRQIDATGLFHD
jgi:hypothetical protein